MIYYINADIGDDTNGDGSAGNPWLTIAHAHDNASDGDTIVCQDSAATYTYTSQAFTKSLIITGEQDDASGAVFDGGGGRLQWSYSVDLTVKKITFTNVINWNSQTGLFQPSVEGTTLTLENCIFHGIIFKDDSRQGIVQVRKSGTVLNFINCLIYDIDIQYNGEIGIVDITGIGIQPTDLTTNFINCTVGVAWDYGRAFEGYKVIKNSIFKGLQGKVLDIGPHTTIASYSCFNNTSETPTGTGVITADPLFVDEDNGDFRLRPSSPCINSGTLI